MKECIFGAIFIFIGSCVGALTLFVNKKINKRVYNFFVGFASGVMMAASIWSLLIPAIEGAQNILVVFIGFIIGSLILFCLDIAFDMMGNKTDYIDKMYFALTLHNIPEGLIVGIAYGYGALVGDFISGHLMAFAIGIQNIPESIALAVPLYNKEENKLMTLAKILISAVVEPVFCMLGFLFFSFMIRVSSFLLSIAAGNMIYVLISELIPEINKEECKIGRLGFLFGFLIMMFFDILI